MKNKELLLTQSKSGIAVTHELSVDYFYKDNSSLGLPSFDDVGMGFKVDSKGNVEGTFGSVSPATVNGTPIVRLSARRYHGSNAEMGITDGYCDLVFQATSETTLPAYSNEDIGSPVSIYREDGVLLGKLQFKINTNGTGSYAMTEDCGQDMLTSSFAFLNGKRGEVARIAIVVGGGITNLIRCFFSQFFRKEVLV